LSDSKSKWLSALKVAGVLLSALGSALGTYHAAKSEAKTEAKTQATVSYESLAGNLDKIRIAVENLQENEKRLWSLVLKERTAAKPDAPASTGGSFRPRSAGSGSLGFGRGSATGVGFGRGGGGRTSIGSASTGIAVTDVKGMSLKASAPLKPIPKLYDEVLQQRQAANVAAAAGK